MIQLNQIKPMLATAAGLTKQQTETMADGDWHALRDRLMVDDPPESDLRACLTFARRNGAAQLVAYYKLGIQQEKKDRFRRDSESVRIEIGKTFDRDEGHEAWDVEPQQWTTGECRAADLSQIAEIPASPFSRQLRAAIEAAAKDQSNLFAKKLDEMSRKISDAVRLPAAGVAGGMAPSPRLKAAEEAEEKRVRAERREPPALPESPLEELAEWMMAEYTPQPVEIPKPTFTCPNCTYAPAIHECPDCLYTSGISRPDGLLVGQPVDSVAQLRALAVPVVTVTPKGPNSRHLDMKVELPARPGMILDEVDSFRLRARREAVALAKRRNAAFAKDRKPEPTLESLCKPLEISKVTVPEPTFACPHCHAPQHPGELCILRSGAR